ncbi:MAG: VCBS repeat-containing protein [Candidatus Woesearchaeota archaeon]
MFTKKWTKLLILVVATLFTTFIGSGTDTGAFDINFILGKDITINNINAGSDNVIISSKEIKNIDDSNALDKFTHLKGFKDISFDVSSSKGFNVDEIKEVYVSSEDKVESTFKLNNLEIITKYKEIDTSFFNRAQKPIKQTYIIKNLLNEPRNIKLNIKYEIDSDVVTWNNIEYEITKESKYFKAFYAEGSFPEIDEPSLTGHILYFDHNYYDFKDIVNLDYKISVYSSNKKNYIYLEINFNIDRLEEFVLDPEIGWTTRVIDNSAYGTEYVYAIDINNDVDVDVVANIWDDDKIVWYENDGSNPPTWTKRDVGAIDSPSSVYAEDLDEDTNVDVLSTAHFDNVLYWYENDGSNPPSWTRYTIGSGLDHPRSVYATYIDGDEYIDIVVGDGYDSPSTGNVYWYENNEDSPPTWTRYTIDSSLDVITSVYAIDINGDNDIDVVAGSWMDDTVRWYENPTWTPRDITTLANGVRSIYAIDINGDEDIDVLSADQYNDDIAWYKNDGSDPPSWTRYIINSSIDSPLWVFAKDLDKDGDADVIASSQTEDVVVWYENDGSSTPTWTAHTITSSADGVRGVYAIDLDEDSDVDVVSASYFDDTVRWYKSDFINCGDGLCNSGGGENPENCPDDCDYKYTYLWIPFGNWSSQEEFENAVEARADFFMDISPLGDCKKFINNIPVPVSWVNNWCPYVKEESKASLLTDTYLCAETYRLLSNPIFYEKAIGLSKDHFCFDGGGHCRGISRRGSRYAYAETPYWLNRLEVPAHELGHAYSLCDEYNYANWSSQNSSWLSGICPNLWEDTYDEDNPINHPCSTSDDGKCIDSGWCCGSRSYSNYSGIYTASGNNCSDGGDLYNVMGYGATKRRCGYSYGSYNKLGEFLDCSGARDEEETNIVHLTFEFNISNPTQENVSLDEIYTYYDYLPAVSTEESLYELKILDGSEIMVHSENLQVFYFEFVDYDYEFFNSTGGSINEKNDTFTTVELEYNSSYEILQVFKNDTLIYEENISTLLCNENDVCDGKENYFSCSQDCSSGSQDGICDRQDDGICDPDCSEGADLDCQIYGFELKYQNLTETIFSFNLLNNLTNQLNISWNLTIGDGNKISSNLIGLESDETIFNYVNYNYSSAGNYLVNLFTYNSTTIIDNKTINITI